MHEMILILDFGSQYTQLIARRIRELQVYCEIYPYKNFPDIDEKIKGVILSGSPFSVQDNDAPVADLRKILSKVPILGICYGAQYLAKYYGGSIVASKIREYGRARLNYVNASSKLMKGVVLNTQVWMSHGDTIRKLPGHCQVVAGTEDVEIAAYQNEKQNIYGLQFHPEVYHTAQGVDILKNFVLNICKATQSWNASSFVKKTVDEIKNKIGSDKVVLGLSGGVDSTVAAVLLKIAIGNRLHCIFVDNGLLRKGEFASVLEQYKNLGLNIKGVDAANCFYDKLSGITDPEEKRKIIGSLFISVFDKEAHKIKDVKWLAQGTIYPDVIESTSVNGPSSTIKSHHNVGGLPKKMKLKVIEPLASLFKDEVRKVGKELAVPKEILNRHPFPGPGLGIRILGEVNAKRVSILQEVDHLFVSGLKREGLYDEVWQAGAMLLPVQTVGVMGDERTYEHVVALRAVSSTDGMTADWCHLPYEFLANISGDIINKVKGVNRVVYDISSKPPATIEWE